MTNPYTRFLRSLRSRSQTSDVEAFVANWDVVEAIVTGVNRRRAVTEEERAAYAAARAALLANYEEQWAPRFAPHWPETKEAGQATPADPFPRILSVETADGFLRNRPTMQALAAARETLNRYVLSLDE